MILCTEEEFRDLCNDIAGVCLNCHHVSYGVEPDAERYKCDNCGERRVFGMEAALMMGALDLVDDSNQSSIEY